MKRNILWLFIGFLLIGTNLFAADGDLIVNGKLGVGTTAPAAKLELSGNDVGMTVINTKTTAASYADLFKGVLNYGLQNKKKIVLGLRNWNGVGAAELRIFTRLDDEAMGVTIAQFTEGITAFTGNVGIGTTTPQGKLDVNGSIYQRGSVLHADYVFGTDYKLASIEENAKDMWKNKHLKAIPQATVDENGQEVIELGAHLKGVVEELEKAHIYIEQLQKNIKVLEERIGKLEK
jgi:hypothetical protein